MVYLKAFLRPLSLHLIRFLLEISKVLASLSSWTGLRSVDLHAWTHRPLAPPSSCKRLCISSQLLRLLNPPCVDSRLYFSTCNILEIYTSREHRGVPANFKTNKAFILDWSWYDLDLNCHIFPACFPVCLHCNSFPIQDNVRRLFFFPRPSTPPPKLVLMPVVITKWWLVTFMRFKNIQINNVLLQFSSKSLI